jgi:alkylation response protein AidB-like acyl-CoA dehydrogenase
MGLNGVDNGQIWFTNVRVPRDAMLDRWAGWLVRCVPVARALPRLCHSSYTHPHAHHTHTRTHAHRYASVDEASGAYSSPIPTVSGRFGTMVGGLTMGRILIAQVRRVVPRCRDAVLPCCASRVVMLCVAVLPCCVHVCICACSGVRCGCC